MTGKFKLYIILSNIGLILNSLIPSLFRYYKNEPILGSNKTIGILLIFSSMIYLSNSRIILISQDLLKKLYFMKTIT